MSACPLTGNLDKCGCPRADVTAVCGFCGKPVDPYSRLTYRMISGFDHPREGGGTNALALAKRHDVWACTPCVSAQKRGINVDQIGLLG